MEKKVENQSVQGAEAVAPVHETAPPPEQPSTLPASSSDMPVPLGNASGFSTACSIFAVLTTLFALYTLYQWFSGSNIFDFSLNRLPIEFQILRLVFLLFIVFTAFSAAFAIVFRVQNDARNHALMWGITATAGVVFLIYAIYIYAAGKIWRYDVTLFDWMCLICAFITTVLAQGTKSRAKKQVMQAVGNSRCAGRQPMEKKVENQSVQGAEAVVPIEKDGTLICPVCGEARQLENPICCWSCGVRFTERADAPRLFCRRCRRELTAQMRYCPACGTANIAAEPPSAAPETPTPSASPEAAERTQPETCESEPPANAVMPTEEDGKLVCPVCGEKQPKNRTCCWGCGVPFLAGNASASEEPAANPQASERGNQKIPTYRETPVYLGEASGFATGAIVFAVLTVIFSLCCLRWWFNDDNFSPGVFNTYFDILQRLRVERVCAVLCSLVSLGFAIEFRKSGSSRSYDLLWGVTIPSAITFIIFAFYILIAVKKDSIEKSGRYVSEYPLYHLDWVSATDWLCMICAGFTGSLAQSAKKRAKAQVRQVDEERLRQLRRINENRTSRK